MKENKVYTAADFADYHAGTMPDAEMYALEKAALDDSFLADALEGYANTDSAVADVDSIKETLAEKRENKKVFFLSPFANKGWLRIAALLVIIAGAGYFFTRFNDDKSTTLAENKTVPAVPVVTQTDSSFLNTSGSQVNTWSDSSVRPGSSATVQTVTIPQGLSAYAVTPAPVNNSIDEKKFDSEIARSDDAPASPVFSSSQSRDLDYYKVEADKNAKAKFPGPKTYVISGKVIDDKGAPVPFASISKNGREGTVADSIGYFSFGTKDSLQAGIASAIGYQAKRFSFDKNTQPVIQLERTEAELNDVTVTALGVRRQAKETGAAVTRIDSKTIANNANTQNGKVSATPINPSGTFRNNVLSGTVNGRNINSRSAETDTGLVRFKNYIETNTPLVYDKNKQRLSGKVTLAYSLDSNARPQNIRIVKSSCAVCEQEAVKILQNAPATRSDNNNRKNRVVIRF